MSECLNNDNSAKKTKKSLKLVRFVFFIIFIFIVSGASLIIIDRYLFPYLATVKWIGKYKFFQKATEKVVMVNKTEQVTVSEDQTVSRYTNKSAASVVEIVSQKKDAKNFSKIGLDENSYKVGSGLIVTADGLVVTYKEAIIEDQAKYKVFTDDGLSYEGRLISIDPFTNLAFIKLDGVENLSAASFIAPEDIRVGAKIIVIGKGGNNSQDVFKSGLISLLAQDYSIGGPVPSSEKLQGVFFSDIYLQERGGKDLIGGIVTDFNGDVIGLLGAEKTSEGWQYFIIPVNHIKYLADKFIEQGSVARGKLGLYYLSLTKELAYLGVGSDHGALVYSPSLQQGLAVISGSSAEKAGIRIMDVIMSVNGDEVNPGQNLALLVSKYKSGDEITFKLLRDGKEMEAKAVLQ
jgi:S1-C subfamily serine protease